MKLFLRAPSLQCLFDLWCALSCLAFLQAFKAKWTDLRNTARGARGQVLPAPTGDVYADFAQNLPASTLGRITLPLRLALLGVVSWTFIITFVNVMLVGCLLAGRAMLSEGSLLFPAVRLIAPPRWLYHDPLIAVLGYYVTLHVLHILTVVGVSIAVAATAAFADMREQVIVELRWMLVSALLACLSAAC